MKRVLTITLLGALLVALTANVAAAHKGGPHHGNTYSKNFYPPEYFRYCEPDGADYFTGDSLSDRCDKGYSEYRTKWANGKKYYYVKTFFEWVSPVLTHTGASKSGTAQRSYYCALHKYDDPDSKYARLRCQLTDEPSGKRYWEGFDRGKLDPPPNTTITQGPGNHVRDAPAEYRFESSEAGS